ncbi:MAG: PTS ascorbate transporter subunit IIC [Brevinema sp.]
MSELMNIIILILGNPVVIIGFIALIGLLVSQKSVSEITSGVVKVMLGFLMMQGGAGVVVTTLLPFSALFTNIFGTVGVLGEDHSLVAQLQSIVGFETPLIMFCGFLLNILIARITKWKYIMLTGHLMYTMAGTMAILMHSFNLPSVYIILYGSLLQGISSTLFPAICQSTVRKVIGSDDVAFGFFGGSSTVCLAGNIGGWLGNPKNSAEDLKFPKSIEFLKDMSILISLMMIFLYGVTAFVGGLEKITEVNTAGVLDFVLLKPLNFTVGILVLLAGVRMLLAELIPSFQGISEKIVPQAIPALDIPIFYPYGPVSVSIGFFSAIVGGLCVTFIPFLPARSLPSVIGLFFQGAAAGVIGNKLGGLRGAIIAGFCLGIFFQTAIVIGWSLFSLTNYHIDPGLWFASTDAIIIVILVRLIAKLFGG